MRSLVPASARRYPDWMRGPFAELDVRIDAHEGALLLVAMFACYLVVIACSPAISARATIAAIVALHAICLLVPPLFSADVFGYIDYARLGVLHGVDPYLHGAAAVP